MFDPVSPYATFVTKPSTGLPHHEDARRRIEDVAFFPEVPMRHSVMKVKEQIPVGNHYHNCAKVFVLTAGKIKQLVFKDTKTGMRQEWNNLGPGTQIKIQPGMAHALIMEPGSVLHMYVFSTTVPSDMSFYKPVEHKLL